MDEDAKATLSLLGTLACVGLPFLLGLCLGELTAKRNSTPKSAVIQYVNRDNYRDIILTTEDDKRKVLFGTVGGTYLSPEELEREGFVEVESRYSVPSPLPTSFPTALPAERGGR